MIERETYILSREWGRRSQIKCFIYYEHNMKTIASQINQN